MSDKEYSFLDIFRFTKDGKPKSSVIVNTFSLSLLYLVIYFLSYYFLIDRIHHALAPDTSVWLYNCAESILPAIAGTMLCALPALWIQNKQYIIFAYGWLFLYAVIVLVIMLIMLWKETDAFLLFLNFYALFVPAPLIIGGGTAYYLMKYHHN